MNKIALFEISNKRNGMGCMEIPIKYLTTCKNNHFNTLRLKRMANKRAIEMLPPFVELTKIGTSCRRRNLVANKFTFNNIQNV